MTWAKLDDRFPRHRRIRELRGDTVAKWIHVVALCHCAENLTDGLIDEIALEQIISDAELSKSSAFKAVPKLESSGLWVRLDGRDAWVIRDYLEYNPPANAVKGRREQAKERMRTLRHVRANSERTSQSVRGPRPVPVPVPKEQDPKPIVRNEQIQEVTTAWTAHAPPLIEHRPSYLADAKTSAAIERAFRKYPLEAVLAAVENYAAVVGGSEYRWDHRWTLIDFLNRGLDKFVAEADPLSNFRIRDPNDGRPNMKYGRRDVSARELLDAAERIKTKRIEDERKALASG